MAIRIHKVHDAPGKGGGARILVDALWPRGITKERASVDRWMKEIAPSTELRRWYGHDPALWDEFRARYDAELADKRDSVEELLDYARTGDLTLVFGSKERELNNAAALKAYLEARL